MGEAAVAFPFDPRVFVRVYELPARLTEGYCHGGGRAIAFLNVDWFTVPADARRDWVIEFIQGKRYFHADASYLVLADDPQHTFTFGAAIGASA